MIQKTKLSSLVLNACLVKLTEGWDEDAARAVAQAFCHLPNRSRRVKRSIHGQGGISTRGHTDEMGDVNVDIPGNVIQETIKGEKEGEAERVGYFKIYRVEGKVETSALITFEYFWNADIVTRSPEKPPNPFYGVEYCTNTLEPYALLIFEWEEENLNLWHRTVKILKSPSLALLRIQLAVGLRHGEIKRWRAVPGVLYGKSKILYTPRYSQSYAE